MSDNNESDSINSEINENDKKFDSHVADICVNTSIVKEELDIVSNISSVINANSNFSRMRDSSSVYSNVLPSTDFNSKKIRDASSDELAETKKISMLLNLKDKEIRELKKNYEILKNKYNENKKKLINNYEKYKSARTVNFNTKKLICQMIMNKSK